MYTYTSLMSMHPRYCIQGSVDLEAQIKKCDVPVYIGVVISSAAIELFVVAEGIIFETTDSFNEVLTSLLATYYTFNIQYVSLYAFFIFIQRFVFGLVDSQTVPPIVTRTISSMDNLVQ